MGWDRQLNCWRSNIMNMDGQELYRSNTYCVMILQSCEGCVSL